MTVLAQARGKMPITKTAFSGTKTGMAQAAQAILTLQRKVTSYTSPYSGQIDTPFS